MKKYFFLLFALLMAIHIAHPQMRTLSGKKTTDSVKVKNASEISPVTKIQNNSTVIQPVSTGVIIPNSLIPQPVMATFAPQDLVPTPEMTKAYNWWMSINPTDFTIYTSPFKLVNNTTGETTIEKFIGKQSISLRGWVPPKETVSGFNSDSLIHLLAMNNLVQIDLLWIDDKVANFLGQMPGLKAVYYHSGTAYCQLTNQNQFSDIGLERLLQNRLLEYVGFQANDKITNSGFEHFRGMNQLKVLYTMCWTGITDDALFSLEGCSALETLYFIGSNITDQGLNNLLTLKDKLPYLTRVYVNGSKTTRDGEAAFRNSWGRPIEVFYR